MRFLLHATALVLFLAPFVFAAENKPHNNAVGKGGDGGKQHPMTGHQGQQHDNKGGHGGKGGDKPKGKGKPLGKAKGKGKGKQDGKNGGKYKLVDMYKGKDFFDKWNFFTQPDPTHGSVTYISLESAKKKNLANVAKNGVVTLAVDDKTKLQTGKPRDSIRISSKKTYDHGLFIADFAAMPFGCGVWPAWWSVGPNWPAGGEIDVLEGVHNGDHNQCTLHTSPGCTLDRSASSEMTGKILSDQCASSPANNMGCAIQDTDARSFGKGFNAAGGGVYAHLWNGDGVKIWHFARKDIPKDIKDKKPDPTKWHKPQAEFKSKTCPMTQHFYKHVLTIDTTLCGDWAGSAQSWQTSGCKMPSCADAVADPANFKNAKWKINYIAAYEAK